MSQGTSPLEQINVFSRFILQFHILGDNIDKEDAAVNCLICYF